MYKKFFNIILVLRSKRNRGFFGVVRCVFKIVILFVVFKVVFIFINYRFWFVCMYVRDV